MNQNPAKRIAETSHKRHNNATTVATTASDIRHFVRHPPTDYRLHLTQPASKK